MEKELQLSYQKQLHIALHSDVRHCSLLKNLHATQERSKNSTHELISSITSSSGLIYGNELEILVPIDFAEMFATLFRYNYGNTYYMYTSSFQLFWWYSSRRRYYNYVCIFNLIFKSTSAERVDMCLANVMGQSSVITLKDIIT